MMSAVLKRVAAVGGLAAIGLLAANGAALADSATTPKTQVPPTLQKAVQAGRIKIKKRFKTAAPGIIGYVVEQKGQQDIVYGDHGYLIIGRLVSPEGKNLSAQYTDKYIPKPDVSKVINQLKSSGHLVQQGPDDAPVLYAFADPNCIYCHRFYEEVQPMVKAGKLQVQWAMVGFLKDTSMGRAAAILSADDPAKALIKNENGFDEKTENGGIKPDGSPSDKLKTVINDNYKRMAAIRANGTPTVLYKDGDQWHMRVGMPPKQWIQAYINGNGDDSSKNNGDN